MFQVMGHRSKDVVVVILCGVWGPQERQLWGGGSCTQLGYPGLGALMELCARAAPLEEKALEDIVLTP